MYFPEALAEISGQRLNFCDDGNLTDEDGCDSECRVEKETGFVCTYGDLGLTLENKESIWDETHCSMDDDIDILVKMEDEENLIVAVHFFSEYSFNGEDISESISVEISDVSARNFEYKIFPKKSGSDRV